jgi:hypothetical protein
VRAAAAEIAGRVQLAYVNAEGQYDAIAAEAIMPDETTISVRRNEVPLALTRKEGARIVTRWLQEARVGRDTAEFALPPSQAQIGVGDVVALTASGNTSLYRIDRIEEAGLRRRRVLTQRLTVPNQAAKMPWPYNPLWDQFQQKFFSLICRY